MAIVGVGINVNQVDFDELDNATSLALLGSKNYDVKEVMNKIFSNIEIYYNKLKKGDVEEINTIYFNHLLYGGQWKVYDSINGRIEGKITKVMENGLIELKLKDKNRSTFDFKELSFIL